MCPVRSVTYVSGRSLDVHSDGRIQAFNNRPLKFAVVRHSSLVLKISVVAFIGIHSIDRGSPVAGYNDLFDLFAPIRVRRRV
jgi:hypothetical protein